MSPAFGSAAGSLSCHPRAVLLWVFGLGFLWLVLLSLGHLSHFLSLWISCGGVCSGHLSPQASLSLSSAFPVHLGPFCVRWLFFGPCFQPLHPHLPRAVCSPLIDEVFIPILATVTVLVMCSVRGRVSLQPGSPELLPTVSSDLPFCTRHGAP